MDYRVFDSKNACRKMLRDLLRQRELSPELAESIATRLAEECFEEEVATKDIGFGLRVGDWVIRQEDLAFFDVLKAGITLGVAASLGDAVAGPIVGAVTAAAYLGWTAWRKGYRLTPLQVRILCALEASENGLTVSELGEGIDAEGKISQEQLQQALTEMTKLIARSGAIPIVAVDMNDRWHSTH